MSARIRPIEIATTTTTLEDQGLVEGQGALIGPFLERGRRLAARLGTARVWMLNSTASGGGVAEILPHTCSLLREVGLDARWIVLEPHDEQFFVVTKALHHLLHGKENAAALDADARPLFERVSAEGARALVELIEPGDVVVIHDPQPCGIPAFLPEELRARLVWRCHGGVPFQNEETAQAWRFLDPWLTPYRRLIFSSDRYVPEQWKGKSSVMHPSIDPLSHKNRELRPYKAIGILRSASLVADAPPAWARFTATAQRWLDGRFVASPIAEILTAPMLLHVSRFDPLKGFAQSIEAFRRLAEHGAAHAQRRRAHSDRCADELARCILVLAGPDPEGVADDPEARVVLADLCRRRDALPPAIAARVHIVKLPMDNRKENALIVNALQHLATVVLQPSLEEGFGLTVTEALWKGATVVATRVGGIAQQIRPGVDGLIVDPNDPDALAHALIDALVLPTPAARMGRSGRRRVAEHFLSLREGLGWLDVIGDALGDAAADAPAHP